MWLVTLLVMAAYAALTIWRVRRRAVRDTAQVLRQLPMEEREKLLEALADRGMRTDLSRVMSDDQPLPDQAGVARFHVAPGSRRELLWSVARPLIGVAASLAIVVLSGAVNPSLNILCGAGALAGVLLILWRLPRFRRGTSIIEVSAFNLTEISRHGRRRVLSWRQPLLLRFRASRRRVEIGPAGSPDRICIDTDLLEFRRAMRLIMGYGGFVVQPPLA